MTRAAFGESFPLLQQGVVLQEGDIVHVADGQQMLYAGIPDFSEGDLITDGDIVSIEPGSAELLATLGEVLALDEFLVGGSSPATKKTPTEVRTILDVLTSGEVDTAISDALAAAGPDLAWNPTLQAISFTAALNTAYRAVAGITVSLPGSGMADGDRVGIYVADTTGITVDGNGNNIQLDASTESSINVYRRRFILFRWSADGSIWEIDTNGFGDLNAATSESSAVSIPYLNGPQQRKLDLSTQSVPFRGSGINVQAAALAADSVLGRVGTGDLAGVALGTFALLGRADSGDLASIAIGGSNSVVGRSSGPITGISFSSSSQVLGRDVLGNPLGPLNSTKLVEILSQGGVLAEGTLSDGATIIFAVGGPLAAGGDSLNANVTLGGDRTLNITGSVSGQRGILRVIQDGAGTRLITAYQRDGVSDVIFPGGTAPTLTTTPGAEDWLEWIRIGSKLLVREYAMNVS